jgi:hypothetical protein
MRGAKAKEQVHMIINPAYGFRDNIKRSRRTADERVQAITPFFCDPRFAILCAEDNVEMQSQMGGGHERVD